MDIMGQYFKIGLRSGLEGAHPPPPLTVSLTMKFMLHSKLMFQKALAVGKANPLAAETLSSPSCQQPARRRWHLFSTKFFGHLAYNVKSFHKQKKRSKNQNRRFYNLSRQCQSPIVWGPISDTGATYCSTLEGTTFRLFNPGEDTPNYRNCFWQPLLSW